MSESLKIKLNGKDIEVKEGETILEVAYRNGINIPNLCYHPDTQVKANCRVCVVEIKGRNNLPVSCATKVAEGMEIETESPKVVKARRVNLELIFAEHVEKCPTCPLRTSCKLLLYASNYKLKILKFNDRKKKRKIYKFNNAIEIDGTQCIDCRNCIDACNNQAVNFLKIKNYGSNSEIVPVTDGKHDCVYCGQCAVYCPVTSAQEQLHYSIVDEILNNKKGRTVVAQIDSSAVSAINEILHLPYEKSDLKYISGALKEMGFDYIADVNVGEQIMAMIESQELVKKLKDEKNSKPIFSSRCPSFNRFIEFYYPDFVSNLLPIRSAQSILGGILKTYWANKMTINPKNIVVISLTACTAQKFESRKGGLKVNGIYPVDHVLTTRELGFLLEKKRIDLTKFKAYMFDDLLSNNIAGSICGVSGGSSELMFNIIGSNKANKLKQLRGLETKKEAEITIDNKKIKIAVINTLGEAKNVLDELRVTPNKYDYVEFMACPGGCIGGGGQPIPTTPIQRRNRSEIINNIDKKNKLKKISNNIEIEEIFESLKNDEQLFNNLIKGDYKKYTKPNAYKS